MSQQKATETSTPTNPTSSSPSLPQSNEAISNNNPDDSTRVAKKRHDFNWIPVRNVALISAASGSLVGVALVAAKKSSISAIPQMGLTWGLLGFTFMGCRQYFVTNPAITPVQATAGTGLIFGLLASGFAMHSPQRIALTALGCSGASALINIGYDSASAWAKEKRLERLYEQELYQQKLEKGLIEPQKEKENQGWFSSFDIKPVSEQKRMDQLLEKALKYEEELRRKEEAKKK